MLDFQSFSHATLIRLWTLRARIDEHLERSLVDHDGVEETLTTVLADLREELGLEGAFVHTFTADLALHTLTQGDVRLDEETRAWTEDQRAGGERTRREMANHEVYLERLDVAGTWFGAIGLVVSKEKAHEDLSLALHMVCEILDNFLYAVAAARRKHVATLRLGDALRHQMLDHGLREAVRVLAEELPLGKLLLVFHASENDEHSLHVQMYEGADLKIDTLERDDTELRAMAQRMLHPKEGPADTTLAAHFGIDEHGVEEILINGVTESVLVGNLRALPTRGHFNTYDRDLLATFAGFVRQRIVDFNKEWRSLATIFRADDVSRLVRTSGYRARFLSPREEPLAILFADIAGFTRLSERVLKTPSRVARLVEVWSKDAVDIVWRYGGTFDKMVGDCVIALFGPPFYESSVAERLDTALRTALELREMTQRLPELSEFAELREDGLHVSIGVNLAPVCVGFFGPDGDFTGFSSGMNNTARLQGCARAGEILVMDAACDILGEGPHRGYDFGATQEAAVKNVADPLRFRPLAAT